MSVTMSNRGSSPEGLNSETVSFIQSYSATTLHQQGWNATCVKLNPIYLNDRLELLRSQMIFDLRYKFPK